MGCGPSKRQPTIDNAIKNQAPPPQPVHNPATQPQNQSQLRQSVDPRLKDSIQNNNSMKMDIHFNNDFNNYDAIQKRNSLTKISQVIGPQDRDSMMGLNMQIGAPQLNKGGREDIRLQSTDHIPQNESLNLPKEIHIKTIVPQEDEKQKFYLEYESLSKDPGFCRVSVGFILDGPDGIGRRLYYFHVRKMIGTVKDIKKLIQKDFGYDLGAQRIYRLFKELTDEVVLSNLKDYDPNNEVLMFIPKAPPIKAPQYHFRPKIEEISIENIKKLNCSNISYHDFESYNTEDNLVWPPYKDWTHDGHDFVVNIMQLRDKVSLQQDLESVEMSQLMLYESEYKKLVEQFEFTAKKIVSMIVQWKIDPVPLDNMFGYGGNKFIAGGMLIRECRNWYINRTNIGDGDYSYKIANHERNAMEAARFLTSDLIVPLCCIVDYYGMRYFAVSLCPITKQSCSYGSNNQGLTIEHHGTSAKLAKMISETLNIKLHKVKEISSGKLKDICLSFDTEIHREPTTGLHYLISAPRLYPPDLQENEEENEEMMIICKLLRPEYVELYHEDEIKEGFECFTWQNPQKCSECQKVINEFEYYYNERRGLESKSIVKQYFCCINCYDLLKERNGFQVPKNKLIFKKVPEKERVMYWVNKYTGERIDNDYPIIKVPLDPDSCVNFEAQMKPNIQNLSELQDEFNKKQGLNKATLKKASERLYAKIIKSYLTELSSLAEIPKTSREITDSIHARGINMRYLGKLADESTHNHVKEIFVREILARGIKVLIRDGLSFLRDEPNGFSTLDVKKCVLHYLNEIFTIQEREASRQVWDFLTDMIRKKFKISITKDILHGLHLHGLLLAIAEKINLRFETDIKQINLLVENPFKVEDIASIQPKTKVKSDVMFSVLTTLERARRLDQMGKRSNWYLDGGPEREQASKLFKLAVAMSEQIFGEHSKLGGLVYKETAEHFESRHCEKGRPEYSIWNRCAIIPDDNLSSDARFYYNKSILAITTNYGEYNPEIAECCIGLARLHKGSEQNFVDSSIFKRDLSQDEALMLLLKAVNIMEVTVGVDHPETAEVYTKLALALQEKGRPAEGSPYIRRAFSIFAHLFSLNDEITLKTFDYLKAIENSVESGLDKVPIENILSEIERLEFAQEQE